MRIRSNTRVGGWVRSSQKLTHIPREPCGAHDCYHYTAPKLEYDFHLADYRLLRINQRIAPAIAPMIAT